MSDEKLSKLIGTGAGSQIEYSIYVENGRVFYETENDGYRFLKHGAEESRQEITLDDLKHHHVRGGHYYEAAKAEAERQLQILKEREAKKSQG